MIKTDKSGVHILKDCTNFQLKGEWWRDKIIGHTENWYAKSVYGVAGPDVKLHAEYSYVHRLALGRQKLFIYFHYAIPWDNGHEPASFLPRFSARAMSSVFDLISPGASALP